MRVIQVTHKITSWPESSALPRCKSWVGEKLLQLSLALGKCLQASAVFDGAATVGHRHMWNLNIFNLNIIHN
jgi:hypothetical protein